MNYTTKSRPYRRKYLSLTLPDLSYQFYLSSIFIFFILIFPLLSNASTSDKALDKCMSNYLVFDVGSSTTKSTLYKKNKCKNDELTSKKVLNRNYPYQSCLNDAKKNGIMPQECIVEGVRVMKSIREELGTNCNNDNTKCYAFVTAWGRNTDNIHEWIEEVKKIGVKPTLASQSYEGEIKLNAMKKLISNTNKKDENFIVFDIGGASFQLGWIDEHGNKSQYHGLYGTDNFTHMLQKEFLADHDQKCISARNKVILAGSRNEDKEMQKQILQEVLHHEKKFCNTYSLATIPLEEINAAIGYAKKTIGKSITQNKDLQHFIKSHQPILIGDSLLFNLGLKKQLGIDKEIITKSDIYNVMESLAGLNYSEIIAKYPKLPEICINTTQPAMIMLYVIMESLNANELHIAESDHTEQFLHQQITAS